MEVLLINYNTISEIEADNSLESAIIATVISDSIMAVIVLAI